MPFAASAAGLGKLTVFSGLGEPLNAEIELSASKEELASLAVRIAPAETYTEQGLDRPASLSALKLEVGKQANGSPVIKLSSAQPVNDPFLDMLIQIEWSTGRLLREYTALLDPPGYGTREAATAPAPQIAPPSTASKSPVGSTPKSGVGKKGTKVSKAAPDAATEQHPATGEGYTTQPGDTLRGIAKQQQLEGVSLEQMLVGLYQANKDAFIDGNMNRLKVGQIIRTPSSEEIQALSQQQALSEIRVHTKDWHAYRNKLAGAVAESAPENETVQGQSASGKIAAPAEDKGAQAPTGPRDVVKLSKGEAPNGKPGAAETVVDKQNASKDDAVARAKASKEADERIALLEKQLQESQRLLQLKGQAPAEQPKAAAQTPPPPAVPAAAPPKQEAKPVEAKPAEVKPVETPKSAEAPKPAVAKPPKVERKPVVTPPPAEPAPEPSLLDDPLVTGGVGGGLLVLLGGIWLFLRNKQRKSLDSFEQGILTTSGLKPNTVFGNTAGGMVDTGDTSFLTDLSQGSGGMIDTNDVDPIAEAEVYMAYGRDVQAEEILKDAITKDPKRYELHQKLLEIYANRKDTTAFETLAGELYATLGATDGTWQKFAAMGRALEPSNPLYGAEVQATASSDGAVEGHEKLSETQEFSAAVFNNPPEEQLTSDQDTQIDFASTQAEDDNSLDFDLGGDTELQSDESLLQEEIATPVTDEAVDISAGEEENSGLSLDLTTGDEAVTETPVDLGTSDDNSLDFNFDLPEPASQESVQLDAAEIGLTPEVTAELNETVTLDALPELSVAEDNVPDEAPSGEDDNISFELPEFDLGIPETAAVDTVADLELEGTNAVEALPELTAEIDEPSAEAEEAVLDFPIEEVAPLNIEVPSLDLTETSNVESVEASAVESVTAPDEDAAEEIVFETVAEDAGGLDFNFDVDSADEENTIELGSTDLEPAPALGLPDLNLSGISLDLDESPAAPALETTASATADVAEQQDEVIEEISFSADESADVDTKLDLVSAYTDMGDTEGARELLEEVLREGGPQQRARAQSLLDSLG